jgi:hypothetical protein
MIIGTSGWTHHKNRIGMELMNSENSGIQFVFSIDPAVTYDYLMITDSFGNNGKYSKGIIYGPHIDFRNQSISNLSAENKIYMNFLSPWLKSLGDSLYPGKNTLDLQFPVDVIKFNSSEKIGDPVIYFKRRDRKILNEFLEYRINDTYKIYDYSAGYNEDDFRESVSKAPYCVWIGCHESQGFAFQETLSSDTPIFVIDAISLRDEIGVWDNWMPGVDLPATSASYFDSRCGFISSPALYKDHFDDFLMNLNTYKPRDFAIEVLSPEACVKKWKAKLL